MSKIMELLETIQAQQETSCQEAILTAALLIERKALEREGKREFQGMYRTLLPASWIIQKLTADDVKALTELLFMVVTESTSAANRQSAIFAIGKTYSPDVTSKLVELLERWQHETDDFNYAVLAALDNSGLHGSWRLVEQLAASAQPRSGEYANTLLTLRRT